MFGYHLIYYTVFHSLLGSHYEIPVGILPNLLNRPTGMGSENLGPGFAKSL